MVEHMSYMMKHPHSKKIFPENSLSVTNKTVLKVCYNSLVKPSGLEVVFSEENPTNYNLINNVSLIKRKLEE